MKNFDMVYCVECGHIVSGSHAKQIFKTGFYKTTIPLAHCKGCADKDLEKTNIIQEHHGNVETYSTELSLLA